MPETIDSITRRLSVDRRWNYWLEYQSTQVPDVCPLTNAETIWVESQPTRIPDICPSTDAETIWLESQSSVLQPTQKLLTHIPAVCPSTNTETIESHPSRLSFDRRNH